MVVQIFSGPGIIAAGVGFNSGFGHDGRGVGDADDLQEGGESLIQSDLDGRLIQSNCRPNPQHIQQDGRITFAQVEHASKL